MSSSNTSPLNLGYSAEEEVESANGNARYQGTCFPDIQDWQTYELRDCGSRERDCRGPGWLGFTTLIQGTEHKPPF